MTESYPKHVIGHMALESLLLIGFTSIIYGGYILFSKPDNGWMAISFGTFLICMSAGAIIYKKLSGEQN